MRTAFKTKVSKENNCLHTPYRLKFTVASCSFPVTARLL